jgi:hypothetical protein
VGCTSTVMYALWLIATLLCWQYAHSFAHFTRNSWARSATSSARTTTVRSLVLPPVQCTRSDEGTSGKLPPVVPPNSYGLSDRPPDDNFLVVSALYLATNRTLTHNTSNQQQQLSLAPTNYDWRLLICRLSKQIRALALFLSTLAIRQLRRAINLAPLVTERVAQYLNPPIGLLVSFTILQASTVRVLVQYALWGSLALGCLAMAHDLYHSRDLWKPLQPEADSYTLITG